MLMMIPYLRKDMRYIKMLTVISENKKFVVIENSELFSFELFWGEGDCDGEGSVYEDTPSLKHGGVWGPLRSVWFSEELICELQLLLHIEGILHQNAFEAVQVVLLPV